VTQSVSRPNGGSSSSNVGAEEGPTTAPIVSHVAFCAKAVRVCAWLAAFYTKAPAVAVMDNCDRQGTSLIVVALIATAANIVNEIAADVATPWTFYIGGHRYHLYAQRPDRMPRNRLGLERKSVPTLPTTPFGWLFVPHDRTRSAAHAGHRGALRHKRSCRTRIDLMSSIAP
jgi:hypothetical protein